MSQDHSHDNAMAVTTFAAQIAHSLLEERKNHAQTAEVLSRIVAWMESKDGPLENEWGQGYIGQYENVALDWPTTLANIRKGLKVWGDTTVEETPLVELYYAARLMVQMHKSEVQNREDEYNAKMQDKAE